MEIYVIINIPHSNHIGNVTCLCTCIYTFCHYTAVKIGLATTPTKVLNVFSVSYYQPCLAYYQPYYNWSHCYVLVIESGTLFVHEGNSFPPLLSMFFPVDLIICYTVCEFCSQLRGTKLKVSLQFSQFVPLYNKLLFGPHRLI